MDKESLITKDYKPLFHSSTLLFNPEEWAKRVEEQLDGLTEKDIELMCELLAIMSV